MISSAAFSLYCCARNKMSTPSEIKLAARNAELEQELAEKNRELEIELALEKVRQRTMAMQKSDELAETAVVLFRQLIALGISPTRLYIGINKDDNGNFELWTTDEYGTRENTGFLGNIHKSPTITKMYEGLKAKEKSLVIDMQGKELEDYYRYLSEELHIPFRPDLSHSRRIQSIGYFSHGLIGVALADGQVEATTYLLERFARVFDIAYTRFDDLKLAETRVHDARVEAALEKVGGRAMSMQNSTDLSLTTGAIFKELQLLGINPMRCGVNMIEKNNRKANVYSATFSEKGNEVLPVGWIMLSDNPVLSEVYERWLRKEDYFPVLEGASLKSFYDQLSQGLSIPGYQAENIQYGYFLPFSTGSFYGWSRQPFTEEEIKILKRFTTVIDLTFRRYIELQHAEANTREAVKQASLDRVRAEIASMRTPDDLERITPVIWNELKKVTVPFTRCGIFIMNEEDQQSDIYLSTPEGQAIAAFQLPYHSIGLNQNVLTCWRGHKIYKDHWDSEAFTQWTRNLVQQGVLPSQEHYVTDKPPDQLWLHFVPFLQGMLYVGNSDALKRK